MKLIGYTYQRKTTSRRYKSSVNPTFCDINDYIIPKTFHSFNQAFPTLCNVTHPEFLL